MLSPPISTSCTTVSASQSQVVGGTVALGASPICARVTTRPSPRDSVSHKISGAGALGRLPRTHWLICERVTVRSSLAACSAAVRRKWAATRSWDQPSSLITDSNSVLRVRATMRPCHQVDLYPCYPCPCPRWGVCESRRAVAWARRYSPTAPARWHIDDTSPRKAACPPVDPQHGDPLSAPSPWSS